jgi:putative ABC transport system permease protein
MLHDLKAAVRKLRTSPRVVLPALLTLALGLGLNATIFSGVNALLFNAVPFEHAERLYEISSVDTTTRQDVGVSDPDFRDWTRSSRAFESIAALRRSRFVLEGPEGAELVEGASVSAGLFPLLGVPPALGRGFSAAEERAGQDRVLILSDDFWRRRFGGDRGVLGRPLVVDGVPMTVVGVMPPGFAFPNRAELWKPLPVSEDRAERSLTVVGRARPGAGRTQATGDLDRLAQTASREYPATNARIGAQVTPLTDALYGKYRTALTMLQVAVFFVLLIACSNVANLLLASGVARRSELLIRAALGAGRGRLVRQLLLESLMLALIGGAVGLLVAQLAVGPLASLLPERIARADQIAVDRDVLLFSLALSVVTGLLFGALPSLQAARVDLAGGLNAAYGAGTKRGGRRSPQSYLLVLTLGLAVLLLVGATMLVRSFLALQKVSPGFRPAGVETMAVYLPPHRFVDEQQTAAFYEKALGRLRSLPGVEAAGAIRTLPLTGWNPTASLEVEGSAAAAPSSSGQLQVDVQPVGPGYFEGMGIPVLRGRSLRDADATRPATSAVVNDVLRRRYFGATDPVGKRVRMRSENGFESPWLTVVGVAGDVPQFGLQTEPRPEVYYPSWQPSMTLVVRAHGSRPGGAAELRREAQAAGPGAVVSAPRSLASILQDSLLSRRLLAALMGALAGVALLLSVVGIYGVVSYSVARRTREIGIRMALGASRREVVRLFLWQVGRLVVIGLALGLLGSLALGRGLASLLFQVSPLDAASIVPVLLILGACALLASFLPVRAATRIDPVSTLRAQ